MHKTGANTTDSDELNNDCISMSCIGLSKVAKRPVRVTDVGSID